MRLSKIKLVGFKSFVDPTVLQLPGDLVGIVGPNGCGKSNIIDAVRWVMGESSARSLRGDTMTDVIFNGAATRKPVGQASVELIFDNTSGRLGGQWASYAELAVKRLVSRDGQSSYFLNSVRCRRRDIADIFLGTGLGPRSYAIIEQGMISRVIEARPEELRVFLEEAAGVSRYKERRRETEIRIRHTRENLERLNDVREELSRQLQHLQRQARAATQYREYCAEERRLKAELLTLRWQSLNRELVACEQSLHQEETTLEAMLAKQRHLESQLEIGRLRRIECSEAYNEAQERYYQASTEISRLEHYLQHQDALRRRREEERSQTAMLLEQLEAQLQQDRLQQAEGIQRLASAAPELAAAQAEESQAEEALVAAERALRAEQAVWEAFRRRDSEIQRQIAVQRARIEHQEQQLVQHERRLERLRNEREQLAATDLDRERSVLEALENELAEILQGGQQRLAQVETELSATREAIRQDDLHIRLARERLHANRGRLASLQTLQEAALGQDMVERNEWLQAQNLAHAPHLAELLEVEAGWEAAVEIVLTDWLDAICVPDIDRAARAVAELASGRLTLYEPALAEQNHRPSSGLAARITAPWSLTGLLNGVDTAADMADALGRRASLGESDVLVTPDGVLCGRRWLRLVRDQDDTGVLRREREIRSLEAELKEKEAELASRATQVEQLRSRLHDELEQQRREAQRAISEYQRDHAQTQGQLQALQGRWHQMQERRAALEEEWVELERQCREDRERLELERLQLEEALLAGEDSQTEHLRLLDGKERAEALLRQNQTRAAAARRETGRQTTAMETLQARLAALQEALERLYSQQQQLRNQQARLAQEAAIESDSAVADAESTLTHWLETQMEVEAQMREVRQALNAQEAELESGEQQRSHYERQAENQRRVVEERRLAASEVRLRQYHLGEQLRELAAEPETVLATLAPGANEPEWFSRLAQVERRIQRLGPINLAAIEECAQLTERKQYLDAQNNDLAEALAALENAMRKIDRETRTRFQDTFDRVNSGLGTLFPRLFGGGQAHLHLVGEDMLDAGITIMARPPGKRIGAISLLSGGEKALTAVALVFAIFELNPAPFCLLDEVDAPLDEANIGRFGALVRELSTRVQFIFVTHNKATMEIARHLMGVTMQEPGVSRLVAVDVEEAARLAEAG